MKDTVERDKELMKRKPTVPGEEVECTYMPARGFLRGKLVKKGQVIRIVDLEGEQVPDTIIFDAHNLYNQSNAMNTMCILQRWTKLRIGDGIYSKDCDKLVVISDDTTDGTHNLSLGAFCNEPLNRARYGIPGTPNCFDNFVSAMAPYGLPAEDIDWNSCINFCMDVRHLPDGRLEYYPCHNKPGDYFDLMAQMDIIVAISNCPQERNACNNYNPTAMMAVIFNPNEEYKARLRS